MKRSSTNKAPRRSRQHEEDSDAEPESHIYDTQAPETEQSRSLTHSAPSNKTSGNSWQEVILSSLHTRSTQDSIPRQRCYGRQELFEDATEEQDVTVHNGNSNTSSRRSKALMKSAAQLDTKHVAQLKEEIEAVTNPFDKERYGRFVTGLRELIHWHQEQIETVRRQDLWEMQREQRMVGRLKALLESAFVEREREGA